MSTDVGLVGNIYGIIETRKWLFYSIVYNNTTNNESSAIFIHSIPCIVIITRTGLELPHFDTILNPDED